MCSFHELNSISKDITSYMHDRDSNTGFPAYLISMILELIHHMYDAYFFG